MPRHLDSTKDIDSLVDAGFGHTEMETAPAGDRTLKLIITKG